MNKSAVSAPVLADDTPFSHYTLKHRVIAWVSSHLFDQFTYTVGHGLLQGMKRKGGLGWAPAFLVGGGETREEEFWRSADLARKTIYDVGAFQGILALYFASKAKQVICYEPNRRNRKRLEENVALNGLTNVRVRPTGLGSQRQTLQMVFDPLMPGGASVEKNIATQTGGSGTVTEEIPITTLDADIQENKLSTPDFIKIDIEGFELEALKGARQTLLEHRPELFLEMHGETMNSKRQKVAAIVEYLTSLGYTDIRHVETGISITPKNSAAAAEGHLFCRF